MEGGYRMYGWGRAGHEARIRAEVWREAALFAKDHPGPGLTRAFNLRAIELTVKAKAEGGGVDRRGTEYMTEDFDRGMLG